VAQEIIHVVLINSVALVPLGDLAIAEVISRGICSVGERGLAYEFFDNRAKALIYFRNPKIHELFRQIVKQRWSMHQRLTILIGLYTNLKKASEMHGWDFKDTQETGEYKIHSEGIVRDLGYAEDLKELINLMREEIQRDVEGSN